MVTSVPTVVDLLWPTLQAVKEIGGSGTIDEIDERVIERERFSEELQAVLHNDGPRTKIEYRLAWARTYLKGMSALVNSERGVWAVTETGRNVAEEDVAPLHHEFRLAQRAARRGRHVTEGAGSMAEEGGDGDGADGARDWKEELLDALLELAPDHFEHLASRLLREEGFVSARVTGRTGDGGIDGIGIYQLSLVSFPVFFQCKRYRGSVPAGAVRDFRGAMAGRGDRGLLITTGTFTSEARQEATRDGAPPIDLIDGDRLCDLLKDHRMGEQSFARSKTSRSIATSSPTSSRPRPPSRSLHPRPPPPAGPTGRLASTTSPSGARPRGAAVAAAVRTCGGGEVLGGTASGLY